MHNTIVQILMRYVHVVSAIFAVGGMAFIALCLMPSVRLLEDKLGQTVVEIAARRFQRVLWVSIAGLVVSGVFNWMVSAEAYRALGAVGNALIGTKVLLAMVMFAVAWMGSMQRLRPRVVQMINLHLAAVVILLASILRHLRMEQLH
jgi:uncharacterized membrane protein